mmetsp:Transcript_14620/g.22396  ORF Transcript_14620/g.22396 Transcript_14620/m.22396 type:complete len:508 (-) Transcript_14620:87-1610(-)
MNSILLWRTHNVCVLLPSFSFKENRMNYHRKTLKMPLNSMVFATTILALIERPELFPSFSCGVVAWLMLSLGNNRLSHPSPWERPHSFLFFFSIIAFGRSPSVWSIIKPFEKDLDCADYDNGWEQYVQKAKEAAEKRSADYAASQSPNAVGKNAKCGKSDPATLLFPIQKKLMLVCKHLKFVGNIVTWEESYLSFWVTVSSIVLSVVFLIVPWRLVVFWCARICAWTILGPWMKLVDLYLKGVEEMKKRNREYEKVREEEVIKMQMYGARVKLEDEEKMRDMKIHKFGRFIVRVPQRSLARRKDIPLPESYAKHFIPPSRRSVLGIQVAGIEEEYETVLPGQHLTGSMVPKTEKKYNDTDYKFYKRICKFVLIQQNFFYRIRKLLIICFSSLVFRFNIIYESCTYAYHNNPYLLFLHTTTSISQSVMEWIYHTLHMITSIFQSIMKWIDHKRPYHVPLHTIRSIFQSVLKWIYDCTVKHFDFIKMDTERATTKLDRRNESADKPSAS